MPIPKLSMAGCPPNIADVFLGAVIRPEIMRDHVGLHLRAFDAAHILNAVSDEKK
jgi:hypothetical protein